MSSLRARVTLGLAAVTAALVLVAAVALSSLGRLGGAVDTILRENYRSVIACGEMSEALERQDSAALFAATGNERVAREMLATHREGFERALRVERGNITLPEEGPAVQALARDYADYTAAVDRAMAAPPGAARVDTYFTALLPRFNRVKRDVAAVRAMNQAQMERADRDARAIARRGARITRAAVAAALLLALWLAWRLPGFIVRPVRSFAAAARAIGEGRTDVPVEDPGLRELAPLAEALAAMRDALRAYRESAAGALHDARALSEATMR
jgi:methyl-accepting chemotaxis protein